MTSTLQTNHVRCTSEAGFYRTLGEKVRREPVHAHGHPVTIHVLEGVVYLITEEDERAMTPGDQATVAAGEPHRVFNAGDGDAHVLECPSAQE